MRARGNGNTDEHTFQVLIGILTIWAALPLPSWMMTVSSPYRYSNNACGKSSKAEAQKVSSPYRYSNNMLTFDIDNTTVIVSSPYRYSNNKYSGLI